jgi:hypothetical protein
MHMPSHSPRLHEAAEVKDDKYRWPETAGVAAMVAGIALASGDDDERLTCANALFDQLYEVFSRRR